MKIHVTISLERDSANSHTNGATLELIGEARTVTLKLQNPDREVRVTREELDNAVSALRNM